jgi:hypothetical protein
VKDEPSARARNGPEPGRGASPPDRPLTLGEVFAATAEIYRERVWAALGLGTVVAAALALVLVVPADAARIALLAVAFTAAYAAAARLAAGDQFREAWAQTAVRAPVLLVLTIAVSVPFALGRFDPILLFASVFWLALTGFAIPVTMLEPDPGAEGRLARLGYSMQRSVSLARAHYLHAAGVIAALVLVYIVLGDLLARALTGFADSDVSGAFLLVQVVLAPFFFLGLVVLYFEQRARALSSRRRT